MGLHEQNDDIEKAGIIVRALIDTFRLLEVKFGENGFEVAVSFIEIYNEKVYDLFSDSRDALKGVYKSSDIEKVEVASMEEAIQLLTLANGGRHTRPTKLNPTSSRSHAVFTIHLKVKSDGKKTMSALHLVDLAGSEGAKRTGHEGVALSEGNYINQGLLAVGKVLKALSSGLKVIPYRDSVLTHVLQDSLHPNSFITLLVCVSPTEASGTVSTLNFAQGAKQLKTTPQINEIIKQITKGKTPSKLYQQPLRSKNMNKTPLKRPFLSNLSTVKKPVRHTICTPSKKQRLEFDKPLNSTCFQPRVPTIQDFFHPDNFSEAIEMIRDVPDPAHRESIASVASTNMNVSSSTHVECDRPSIDAPLPPLLTPQSEKQSEIGPSLTISPLLRRIENLETMLNEKLQKLCDTMIQNQSIQVAGVVEMQNEGMMQGMRREIQNVLRQELTLASFMTNTSTVTPTDVNVNRVAVVPPLIETDEADTAAFKEPQPLAIVPRHRATVSLDQTLRRSTRLSIMAAPSNPITIPRPLPSIIEKPVSQKTRSNKLKNINKVMASYFDNGKKDGKVTKKAHREAVFDMINKGSMRDLQLLPQIGPKTAYQIITTRTIKGAFKSWKEVGELPCWRGKMWERFLNDNHLN